MSNDREECLPHPWWREAPLALAHRDVWDSEQGRVVEKRVRAVRTPEQRERERRAKLEHKIAKYRPSVNHSGKRWVGRNPRSRRYTIDSPSTMLRLGQVATAIRSMRNVYRNVQTRRAITKHFDFPSK
jgi:hypothetical protein